jgi:hypothetical protein
MGLSEQLPEGAIVTIEIVAHQAWGVESRVLDVDVEARGVVDIMYVTNDRPYNGSSKLRGK